MHSYLISSKNKNKSLEYVRIFCKENRIDPIDMSLFSFEKAMGIEDVRDLQKKLFLRPIKSPMKISVIDAENGLTTESQNALLKILEEPPQNTIIMILTPQKEMLLPTILSRCKIVDLKENVNISKDEITQYLNILVSLSQQRLGERLKLAQDVSKNKGEASIWLEKMILIARKKLIDITCHSDPSDVIASRAKQYQYLNRLQSLQKTYTIIKTTNANQRLVLENLFLNL